ncbi:CDP-diacylglycerol--serine O-phosphatidyltransferase [Polyangium fumosum]|uniref:CDP-diacylglycerol--serine O-phosphatidyltransferase n=1 Tax=Polyangium fumosum TaxID=889272 RepID=A0A4U1JFR6_9BACT|nr:CDP-diacylglycerol--serine O-phosphatidyltransferase [Polyangium fumosum]
MGFDAASRTDVPSRAVPPLRYFVPNGFTGLSLLLGLGSVVMSAEGDFRLAAWMILWGVLLDKLDGSAARLLNATSKFGVEFDSFADFVVFGIAPAALVYYRLLPLGPTLGWGKHALLATSGLYALALAVRLARFNVTTGGEGIFYGLPGTLMGATIASAYLTWDKYGLPERSLIASPAVLVVAAGLMVSTVRLPKLKLGKNKVLKAFTVCNVVGAYLCGPLRILPEYLFGIALIYTVGGVVYCLMNPSAGLDAEPESAPEPATTERLA